MNITIIFVTHTASEDYNSTQLVVTFAEGASSATIQVPIVDDNQFEGNEDFRASLSVPAGIEGITVSVGDKDMATVTIVDDEEEISVQFDPVNYEVLENSGTVNISLVASAPLSQGYMVVINTVDGNATGQ